MENTSYRSIAFILSFIIITAAIFGANRALGAITTCDSGVNLSYDQAKDALVSGELVINHTVNESGDQVELTIINNTICSISVSASSYKMYSPYDLATQSEQEFYNGTPVINVLAGATETLYVDLPLCAAQYDVWYGSAPEVIANNEPYSNMLIGDQVMADYLCVYEIEILVEEEPVVEEPVIEEEEPIVEEPIVEEEEPVVEEPVIEEPVIVPEVILAVETSRSGSRRHTDLTIATEEIYYNPIIIFPDTGFGPRDMTWLALVSMFATFFLVIYGIITLTKPYKKINI